MKKLFLFLLLAVAPVFTLAEAASSGPDTISLSDFHSTTDLMKFIKGHALGSRLGIGKMLNTGSMVPTINANDFVVIDPNFPYSKVVANDVVAFMGDTITTHRVVRWVSDDSGLDMIHRGNKLETQGDAHANPDRRLVGRPEYRGKVVLIIRNDLRVADIDENMSFPTAVASAGGTR